MSSPPGKIAVVQVSSGASCNASLPSTRRNEFIKEHRAVQELKSALAKQEAIIAQQQRRMESVIARLDQQGAQIQKVSAQLEVSKPALQMTLNNQ